MTTSWNKKIIIVNTKWSIVTTKLYYFIFLRLLVCEYIYFQNSFALITSYTTPKCSFFVNVHKSAPPDTDFFFRRVADFWPATLLKKKLCHSYLRICSNLLKKSAKETLIFWALYSNRHLHLRRHWCSGVFNTFEQISETVMMYDCCSLWTSKFQLG